MTLAVVAMLGIASAAGAATSTPSAFHPIRDLASRVVPSLVPPKGCTPAVIRLARDEGVAPDLRGCMSDAIIPGLAEAMGLSPRSSTSAPQQPGATIVQQQPGPGEPLQPGGGVTLTVQTPDGHRPKPRPPPRKQPPKPGDVQIIEQPPPPGPATGAEVATFLFDLVWDRLNLLFLPIAAIGGLVASRVLVPRPKLEVRLRPSPPVVRFADPMRTVLAAPSVEVTLLPMAAIAPSPLPIMSVRSRT
jgi:hypothetical protein